jgi:hypothetical protein
MITVMDLDAAAERVAVEMAAKKMAKSYIRQDAERLFAQPASWPVDEAARQRSVRLARVLHRDRMDRMKAETAKSMEAIGVAHRQWVAERARLLQEHEQAERQIQAQRAESISRRTTEREVERRDRSNANALHDAVLRDLHEGVSQGLGLRPLGFEDRVVINPNSIVNDPFAHLHRL